MRFARPLSALGAAALLAAGAGLASPADAVVHTSDDGTFTVDAPFRVDPEAASVTVTGTGCLPDASGKPSTVVYTLVSQTGAPSSADRAQTTTAKADGTWSASVPVAPTIKADGGSIVDDKWSIIAACRTYAGHNASSVEAPVLLDNTPITGSTYTISGATKGAQTISVNGSGWTSGKEVTLSLSVVDGDPVAELGKITPNTEGNFAFTTTLPEVADGTYELTMVDTRGENGASVNTIKVTNGVYEVTQRAGGGAGGGMGDPTASATTASTTPAATIPRPSASAKSTALARTGASVTIGVVAVGALLTGGAALLARRRKA